MMRVTVEVVPLGDEVRCTTVETLTIVQVERYDKDPGGDRGYAVWKGTDTNATPDAWVRHWRRDGAAVLAAKALEAISERART